MSLKRQVIGMAKANHPGPIVLEVSITLILSMTRLSPITSFLIALAILAGQCVVLWSNDLLDHPLEAVTRR